MNKQFLFHNFEILKKGSQGTILKASDLQGRLFAIKIDKNPTKIIPNNHLAYCTYTNSSNIDDSPKSVFSNPSQLLKFQDLMSKATKQMKEIEFLKRLQGIKGVPKFYWGGIDPDLERVAIVEELTGKGLEYFHKKIGNFSLSQTLKIAVQVINILKKIHEKGVIHRDIKPDNLAISLNGKDVILLDYGLSKHLLADKNEFKSRWNNQEKKLKFVGNLKFCGLNAHSFKNDTKVDDLLSLGILIIYFLQGSLPWEYHHTNDFQNSVERIGFEKVEFISKRVPQIYPFLSPYFKYLCSVKNDRINYDFLTNIIENWARSENVDLNSDCWDWTSDGEGVKKLENEKRSSTENFIDDSCENTVSDLILNYQAPNL